jgi:sulfatase modifying factor 1
MGEARRGDEGDDLPVTDVSWEQAVRFCNAASEQHRYQPCYREAGVWPFRRWVWDGAADGYRLPTEAEWEYACRAGTTTRWSFGDDPELLGEYAWFQENSDNKAHPVAEKRPNSWGLYDTHGNVWEWCWDRYGPYASSPAINPQGPRRGEYRVVRGGSFDDSPQDLRSANRGYHRPVRRFRYIGFRCVRVPARQD